MISSFVNTSSRNCCSILLLLSTIYHRILTQTQTLTTTKSTITSTTAFSTFFPSTVRIIRKNCNNNNNKYNTNNYYNQKQYYHYQHIKQINQQHLTRYLKTSTITKSSIRSSSTVVLFSYRSINTVSRKNRNSNILSRGVLNKYCSFISTITTSTSTGSSTIIQRLPVQPFGRNYEKYNNNKHDNNSISPNCQSFQFNSISTTGSSSSRTNFMMKEIPSISTCSTSNVEYDDNNQNNNNNNERKWIVCTNCHGEGRIERPLSRKARYKKRKKQSTSLTTTLTATTTKSLHEFVDVVPEDDNKINTRTNNQQEQQQQEEEIDRENQQQQQQQQQKTYKSCIHCNGSGLVPYTSSGQIDTESSAAANNTNFHISIIGGGIGGLALCASLRHRNIDCTIYERDISFNQRQHGYGLTLQQISKQLHSLGIINTSNDTNNDNDINSNDNHQSSTTTTTTTTTTAASTAATSTTNTTTKVPVLPVLPGGITSTKHIVHKIDGTIVGQWGMRHWQDQQQQQQQLVGQNESSDDVDTTNARKECNKLKNNHSNHSNKESENDSNRNNNNKRQNIHIARQALRYLLYEAAIAGTTASSSSSTKTSSPNDNTIIENQQNDVIKWNHKLIGYQHVNTSSNADSTNNTNNNTNKIELQFDIGNNTIQKYYTDLIVGADGIRSYVRNQLFDTVLPNNKNSLRYLQCFVILGICPASTIVDRLHQSKIQQQQNNTTNDTNTNTLDYALSLLDGKTVFQTADGTSRIYVMPYSDTEYMWQLSFPMESEKDAIAMSTSSSATSTSTIQSTAQSQKVKVLQEAINRCQTWHKPILDIIQSTSYESCTGYPVYDRPVLTIDDFNLLKESSSNEQKVVSSLSTKTTSSTVTNARCKDERRRQQQQQQVQTYRKVTILGDAAHPMSPFKGQGANQAMIDALQLSRSIYKHLIVIPERDAKKKESNRKKESNNNIDTTTTSIIHPNNCNNNNNDNYNDKYDDCIDISQRIEHAIIEYEKEMIPRTTIKVHASEAAAQFLHSDIAIQEGNVTRGGAAAAFASTAVASSLSDQQR